MKKLLMYGMAAALLAGCSSTDDDVLSPEASSEDINATVDVSKLMSDVPIEFGTFGGEAYTRGSFDGAIDRTIEDVRVFCLARAAIKTGITQKKTPDWGVDSTALSENVILSVWQNNTKARIEPIEGNSSRGQLVWDDPTETHFYPSKDWYAYDFVACHPAPDSVSYSKGQLLVFFKFDGNEDVMAAKANAPSDDHELAYSSFYFKEVDSPEMPFFVFSHLGTKLVFKFQLKEQPSMNLYVDSVGIASYPNLARLAVKRDNALGKVTVADTLILHQGSLHRGSYWLCEKDGSSIRTKASKYLVTADEPVVVGDCIIIPPGSTESPKLTVWMRDDDGNRLTTTNPITIPRPVGGWKGGKQYNINVKLNSPVIMAAEARVTGWADTSEPEEINVSE